MATYAHLPIYNSAFSILKELYLRVPKFGKSYKHTLGNRMLDASQEIILLIIQANNSQETRLQNLEALRRQSEILTILARIASELNQFGGQKIYLSFAEQTVCLCRQVEGWRKSTLNPRIR